MKKNILIKTLSSVAALASVGGLTTLTTLTSCSNNKPAITINNKKTEWDWIGGTYQLDVTFKNQDDAKLLFSSSDENVAIVDENGLITATGNGITLITAYSSEDSGVYDKFKLNISELWIKGVVYDTNKKPVANVKICYDEKTALTNSDGSYYIKLQKPGSVLYFEKPGYIGEAIASTYSLSSQEHILDVTLTPYWVGTKVKISGSVVDNKGNPVKNRSITFYPNSEYDLYKRHFVTDDDGRYEGEISVPSNDEPVDVPIVIHGSDFAPFDGVISIDPTEHEQVADPVMVQPFQYDVKAYVGNTDANEKIIMHVYHVEDGIKVQFESNFIKAFDDGNDFKLTFTNSQNISNPAKSGHETGEFDITFNSKEGVTAATGDIDGDIEDIEVTKSEDRLHLDVFIPTSFFTFTGTFGVHLYSFGRGTFTPYEHAKYDTQASNELSYVRVDADDALYPASDNGNVFSLFWDTKSGRNWTVTDTLGIVASKYNFGYQVKVAKYTDQTGEVSSKEGFYIMTKYAQPQMAHFLPDGWQPHFFFDPVQYGDGTKYPVGDHDPDEKVKHIAPISGYWMQQFDVEDWQHPFQNKKEYNEIFDDDGIDTSPKVYGKDDFMITYIPFDFLDTDDHTFNPASDSFGFACNLQYHYTGGEWHAWEGKNPTGFSDVPHFEQRASYIRFDKDLNILPYSPVS